MAAADPAGRTSKPLCAGCAAGLHVSSRPPGSRAPRPVARNGGVAKHTSSTRRATSRRTSTSPVASPLALSVAVRADRESVLRQDRYIMLQPAAEGCSLRLSI